MKGWLTARARLSVVLAFVMIGLGIAFLVRTRAAGGGQVGILLGVGCSSRPAPAGSTSRGGASGGPQAARPAARARRAGSLFSVAYGEIASSIYFALGIIALHAVGFTPFVLLGVGVLFLLVALSYAEATSALPETGGAATFVRRASNDLFGFMTGWVLFLDYLIVIALSALFVPHYLAGAFQVERARAEPVGRRRRRRA